MPTTEPTQRQLQQMAEADQITPFTMVNLLSFREWADYAPGSDEPRRSGREAYFEYSKVVRPKIEALGGKIIFYEQRQQLFVGDDDQDFDAVAIVHYPSRKAYLEMFHSPGYQAAIKHRIAGLKQRVLLQCTADNL